MDGPWVYYAKWSKSEREGQIPYNFTYMCNIKTKQQNPNKWTNQTKWKETFRPRVVGSREGIGGGWNEWKGLIVCDEWKLNFWWWSSL